MRARKTNALKPETGQDHRTAARHMRAYREAGLRVEAMILTVPAAMSNQGIIARYHEQVTDRGHGRLPAQANADRAYEGAWPPTWLPPGPHDQPHHHRMARTSPADRKLLSGLLARHATTAASRPIGESCLQDTDGSRPQRWDDGDHVGSVREILAGIRRIAVRGGPEGA